MIQKILPLLSFFILILNPQTSNAAQPFSQWLEGVKAEARKKGISEQIIQESLTGIKPIPRVIELDRKQPEGRMTFSEYYNKVISAKRINDGRRLYKKHRVQLEKAAQKYEKNCTSNLSCVIKYVSIIG